MKVAVYAIALNEEKHVRRFLESVDDADLVVIGDTGSTDRTVEEICAVRDDHRTRATIEVRNFQIIPWRFDMARNAVLASLPADIDWCVVLDLDEVLPAGWRAKLEEVPLTFQRVNTRYVWSHTAAGADDVVLTTDRIHRRAGFTWRRPAHEQAVWYGEGEPTVCYRDDIEFQHWPDSTKSRSSYLDLLAIGARELPTDAGEVFYYGRELTFHGRWADAIPVLERAFDLCGWTEEKRWIAVCLGSCYRATENNEKRKQWLDKAREQDHQSMNALAALAFYYHDIADWPSCLTFAQLAIANLRPNATYLDNRRQDEVLSYDMAALASWHLGKGQLAVRYGKLALAVLPEDKRLIANVEWYKKQNPGILSRLLRRRAA